MDELADFRKTLEDILNRSNEIHDEVARAYNIMNTYTHADIFDYSKINYDMLYSVKSGYLSKIHFIYLQNCNTDNTTLDTTFVPLMDAITSKEMSVFKLYDLHSNGQIQLDMKEMTKEVVDKTCKYLGSPGNSSDSNEHSLYDNIISLRNISNAEDMDVYFSNINYHNDTTLQNYMTFLDKLLLEHGLSLQQDSICTIDSADKNYEKYNTIVSNDTLNSMKNDIKRYDFEFLHDTFIHRHRSPNDDICYDTFLEKLLEFYSNVFNLRLTKVANMEKTLWHNSVEIISIEDDDDFHRGYIYLDLFSRENKKYTRFLYTLQHSQDTSVTTCIVNYCLTKSNITTSDALNISMYMFVALLYVLSDESIELKSVGPIDNIRENVFNTCDSFEELLGKGGKLDEIATKYIL